MSQHPVHLTKGVPETVLPAPSSDVGAALAEAVEVVDDTRRREAYRSIAARWPECLDAWAGLSAGEPTPVARYAYARVGYHRGLDALRASGWKGSGLVRWTHVPNRGFLRSLEALRQAAAALGEEEESHRCALLLRQLEPDWPGVGNSAT